MKIHVVCPIPEDNFPWRNHYSGTINVRRRDEPIVCPVCGLNLRNFREVAEALMKKYVEFLGRFGDKVEILEKQFFKAPKKTNPKILVDAASLLAEVRGKKFLLIIVAPDPEKTKLLEYFIINGEGYDKIIMKPFGANGLGLALQLTHLPTRPSPILSGK